jgi:uncharacterized protein YeaO (DUF488 family)
LIRVARIYEPRQRGEGKRFLVDRLWPRGIAKETAELAGWPKEAAPSHELRKWYGHDPAKWEEFQKRYFAELDAAPEAWEGLSSESRKGTITLLYSSKETELNNAVALKKYLESR